MDRIKALLISFADYNRKYFSKTFGLALAYTIISFVIVALLMRFSNFDNKFERKQVSLLSYFVTRYSANGIYSIVDLSKTVWLFFVSLFSVSLYNFKKTDHDGGNRWQTGKFATAISMKAALVLIAAMLVSGGADIGLYYLKYTSETKTSDHNLQGWITSMVFYLRVYTPLLLFAIALRTTVEGGLRLTARKIFFLLLALWMVNEFSFEVIAHIRRIIIDLICMPFDEAKRYYIETIIAVPLLACFFIVYYVAMMRSWEIMEHKENVRSD